MQVAPSGSLPEGVTKLPFALPLRAPPENPNTKLHETYHGINISVQVRERAARPPAAHAPLTRSPRSAVRSCR